MDLSKLKTSDYLMVGGGLAFLIFGTFTDWIKIDLASRWRDILYTDESDSLSGSGGNAFDFFVRGALPLLLVVGAGVVALLLAIGVLKSGTRPWPLMLLIATGLATVLVLLLAVPGPSLSAAFNIFGGTDEELELAKEIGGIDVSSGIGLWLCFVASAIAMVGAFLKFKESGGDLDDLRDVNKLKGAFGGGSTPPPPPPAPPA